MRCLSLHELTWFSLFQQCKESIITSLFSHILSEWLKAATKTWLEWPDIRLGLSRSCSTWLARYLTWFHRLFSFCASFYTGQSGFVLIRHKVKYGPWKIRRQLKKTICQYLSFSCYGRIWLDSTNHFYNNGLAQDCSNSSAFALELPQTCSKPLIYFIDDVAICAGNNTNV